VSDSVSFDRAAEYYDDTRSTDDETLGRIVALVEEEVAGRGPVLEIGVGTGQLALPLAARGVPVVGLDLSGAMMAKLVEKAGGVAPLPLVRGDATGLPFANGSVGGAYARWVLHLIPNWEDAVAELHRVVAPDGAIAIEPGGLFGAFREVFLRFVEILGDRAAPPGLSWIDREAPLDAAFAGLGRRAVRTVEVRYESDEPRSVARFLDGVEERRWSWTWSIPDDELRAAMHELGQWAEARFGDLTAPQPPYPTTWRVYRT
jgi:SAM-dependent methyltransferase